MPSVKSTSEGVRYLPICALPLSNEEVFGREKQPDGAAELTF